MDRAVAQDRVDLLGRALRSSPASARRMSLEAPLGIEDFRQVRELGLTYVDETHLVRELLDMPGAQVVRATCTACAASGW
jgi:hypothetical protein